MSVISGIAGCVCLYRGWRSCVIGGIVVILYEHMNNLCITKVDREGLRVPS